MKYIFGLKQVTSVLWILIFGMTILSCSPPKKTFQITPNPSSPAKPSLSTEYASSATVRATSTFFRTPIFTAPVPSSTPEPKKDKFLDRDTILALPRGYYLLYYRPELHAISIDKVIDKVIGSGYLEPITYDGKIAKFCGDSGCEIVDWYAGQTWPIPTSISDIDGFYEISPDLKYTVINSIDQHQLLLFSTRTGELLGNISEAFGWREFILGYVKWSPDSKWLAVLNTTGVFNPINGLYLMETDCILNLDTCKSKFVGPYKLPMDYSKFWADTRYSWSPDSQKIVMRASDESTDPETDLIAIFDVKNKQFQQISTRINGLGINAIWLPDNSRLVFDYGSPGGGWETYMLKNNQISLLSRWLPTSMIGVISTYPRPVFQKDAFLQISGAGANLNVRSGAGLKFSVLAQLKVGDQVQLVEGPIEDGQNKWWKVKVAASGLEGYCMENQDWYVGN